MKSYFFTVVLLLFVGTALPIFGQTENEAEIEAYLQRSKEQMVKKQKLIDAQHGHHFGAAFSTTSLTSLTGGNKLGIHLFYGNRLSEHWMLGGYVGADYLTPTTVSFFSSSTNIATTIDRPALSFPVIGEVRLYFGTSRFMPYLFTDIGASISKYTGVVFNTGLGSDINFKGSHTIFLALGLGTNPAPGVSDALGLGYGDQVLEKKQMFAINFRLGYYF